MAEDNKRIATKSEMQAAYDAGVVQKEISDDEAKTKEWPAQASYARAADWFVIREAA